MWGEERYHFEPRENRGQHQVHQLDKSAFSRPESGQISSSSGSMSSHRREVALQSPEIRQFGNLPSEGPNLDEETV